MISVKITKNYQKCQKYIKEFFVLIYFHSNISLFLSHDIKERSRMIRAKMSINRNNDFMNGYCFKKLTLS